MPRGGVASLLDVFPRAWLERLRTRARRTGANIRTAPPGPARCPARAAATRPGAGRRDGDAATAPEPGS